MIEVKDLTKTFKLTKEQLKQMSKEERKKKTVDAVSDLNFVCKPGRIFTLLGPNGAGKTTTLRMIATMLKPSNGSIIVNGYDSVKEASKVRNNLGYLTGSTKLYDRLTPEEFITYFAKLNGLTDDVIMSRLAEYFKLLDMNDFATKRIGKLSTGMKQKTSIVRALIHDPDVVVFDEPTSGVDIIASKNILNLVKELRDKGKTIIFSTHRMGEVSILADDLAIIDKGKLLYNGVFEDFKKNMTHDSLEDEFISIVEEERK